MCRDLTFQGRGKGKGNGNGNGKGERELQCKGKGKGKCNGGIQMGRCVSRIRNSWKFKKMVPCYGLFWFCFVLCISVLLCYVLFRLFVLNLFQLGSVLFCFAAFPFLFVSVLFLVRFNLFQLGYISFCSTAFPFLVCFGFVFG